MKPKALKLICIFFVLPLFIMLVFVTGCEKDEPSFENRDLNILEINSSGCKSDLKSISKEQYVELTAEEGNKLRIKYTNAILSCGGDLDTVYASIYNGKLIVNFVTNPGANCLCNYDLECLIDSLENKYYDIEIYVSSPEPMAKFRFKYFSNLYWKEDIDDN